MTKEEVETQFSFRLFSSSFISTYSIFIPQNYCSCSREGSCSCPEVKTIGCVIVPEFRLEATRFRYKPCSCPHLIWGTLSYDPGQLLTARGVKVSFDPKQSPLSVNLEHHVAGSHPRVCGRAAARQAQPRREVTVLPSSPGPGWAGPAAFPMVSLHSPSELLFQRQSVLNQVSCFGREMELSFLILLLWESVF